jgi:hypothetical protein
MAKKKGQSIPEEPISAANSEAQSVPKPSGSARKNKPQNANEQSVLAQAIAASSLQDQLAEAGTRKSVSELLSSVGLALTTAAQLVATLQDDPFQKRIEGTIELLLRVTLKAALADTDIKNGDAVITFPRKKPKLVLIGPPELAFDAEITKKVDKCPDEKEKKKIKETLEDTIDKFGKIWGMKKLEKVGEKEIKQGAEIECDSEKNLTVKFKAIYVPDRK